MEFSRQEYWSRLPFPPLGDLPNLEIQPTSPASPALQVDSLPTEPTWEALIFTEILPNAREFSPLIKEIKEINECGHFEAGVQVPVVWSL